MKIDLNNYILDMISYYQEHQDDVCKFLMDSLIESGYVINKRKRKIKKIIE